MPAHRFHRPFDLHHPRIQHFEAPVDSGEDGLARRFSLAPVPPPDVPVPVTTAATLNSFKLHHDLLLCERCARPGPNPGRDPPGDPMPGFPTTAVSRALAIEGPAAGQHLEQYGAEAEYVAPCIRRAALDHLRGGVRRDRSPTIPADAGSSSTPPATSARFAGVTAPCAFPASRSLLNDSASCMAYCIASATGSRPSPSRWARVFVSFNGIFLV